MITEQPAEVQQRHLKNRQVVLTDELIKKLDEEATRRTMSRSLLIRLFCEAGLRQCDSAEAPVR